MEATGKYQKQTVHKTASVPSAEPLLCKAAGEDFFWCAMWQYLKVPNADLVSTR